MPQINGCDVCREIRTMPRGKHIPIVIMAGADEVESIKQAYGVGVTDFVMKPKIYSK